LPDVALRPATEADAERLVEIVSSSDWWGDNPYDVLDGETYAVEVGGETVGWLQVWEENEPGYRHAGLDIMLAPSHQGQGVGPDALRQAVDKLVERGHHRITIDPASENERAIRAYEKVGFRRVGVMRQYWRDVDGVWRDGLLMELLPAQQPDDQAAD
jgi:aminoglycoside 6'-N-acetyltransferase